MGTPENGVKRWAKSWLDTHVPGHWRVMPRGGPFGKAGTGDLIICWWGVFVMIEVKSDDGELTDLQRHVLKEVQAAGGVAAVLKGRDHNRMLSIQNAVKLKAQGLADEFRLVRGV